MSGKIFLTSDTHFGHDREFLWGPRGFRSSIEHDEAVIANWNSVVGEDDDVIPPHLVQKFIKNNAPVIVGFL